MQMKSVWAGSAMLIAITFALIYAIGRAPKTPDVAPGKAAVASILPQTGPMTIAAVGDLVLGHAIPGTDTDADFEAIVEIVRGASVAVANLEMNLLGDGRTAAARRSRGPRWTFGSAREASALKTLGFYVVSQANNHATDYERMA